MLFVKLLLGSLLAAEAMAADNNNKAAVPVVGEVKGDQLSGGQEGGPGQEAGSPAALPQDSTSAAASESPSAGQLSEASAAVGQAAAVYSAKTGPDSPAESPVAAAASQAAPATTDAGQTANDSPAVGQPANDSPAAGQTSPAVEQLTVCESGQSGQLGLRCSCYPPRVDCREQDLATLLTSLSIPHLTTEVDLSYNSLSRQVDMLTDQCVYFILLV